MPKRTVSFFACLGEKRMRAPTSSAGRSPVSKNDVGPVVAFASRYSTSASYGFTPNEGNAATTTQIATATRAALPISNNLNDIQTPSC